MPTYDISPEERETFAEFMNLPRLFTSIRDAILKEWDSSDKQSAIYPAELLSKYPWIRRGKPLVLKLIRHLTNKGRINVNVEIDEERLSATSHKPMPIESPQPVAVASPSPQPTQPGTQPRRRGRPRKQPLIENIPFVQEFTISPAPEKTSPRIAGVDKSNARIIIIGAGMSGLAAARKLQEEGFQNIKIVEAQDRVGGRIYTAYLEPDCPLEQGAMFIHGDRGNPIAELASAIVRHTNFT